MYDQAMRRHGWQGDPPANDAEARDRIIDATMRCVDRYGPQKTGLSDVAQELGVTRQTVYRHFASTEDLLIAVSKVATDSYLDRLTVHLAKLTDPVEIIVESMAFTITSLPKDRYLGLLLAAGHSETFLKSVTSAAAFEFGHKMLDRMNVDWAALGFDDRELDELVEFHLRVVQSLVIDPAAPKRTGPQLRAFLRRWVGPGITAAHHPTNAPQ